MDKEKIRSFHAKMKFVQQDYEAFLELKRMIVPWRGAAKIIFIYVVVGVLWILLSDILLMWLINNEEICQEIQIYKGWLYVVVTGGIFYSVIRRTLGLYKHAIDRVLTGYEELSSVHEELLAMNEELNNQNDILIEQKNLQESLRAVRELSSRIIFDAPMIIIVFVKDERLIQFNPYAEKLFGYKKEELIGKYRTELFMTETNRELSHLVKEIANGNVLYDREVDFIDKEGKCKILLWNTNYLHDEQGNKEGFVIIGTDITERREMEDRLQMIAYYDTLTGLPNRASLEEEVWKAIHNRSRFAMVSLDIDNFKHINDTLGHTFGDSFIQYITKLLTAMIEKPAMVFRLIGDEFALLLFESETNDAILANIKKIIQEFKNPCLYKGQNFYITVSMGVAIYPEHGTDFFALMKNAESAMFHQKAHGKDGYSYFENSMYEKSVDFMRMSSQLREAIENKEFLLYYQPQYDLVTGKMIGVEALIRWNHKERGFISPAEFIPFSEKTGQIIPITEWVLQTAINQKREWEQKGYPSIKMSVNISGCIITEQMVFESFYSYLESIKLKAGELEVEVTETAVMMELDKAKESLERLRKLGITIAMDDFGTGYSSLNYLKILPFDILKIDREFVNNITDLKEDYIYKTLIELAHNMNLIVVAEGIETLQQKDFLIHHHCDVGQGYFLARPMPSDQIERMLANENTLH